MRQMHDLLKGGGHLCLFVPALPWLYGSLDVQLVTIAVIRNAALKSWRGRLALL